MERYEFKNIKEVISGLLTTCLHPIPQTAENVKGIWMERPLIWSFRWEISMNHPYKLLSLKEEIIASFIIFGTYQCGLTPSKSTTSCSGKYSHQTFLNIEPMKLINMFIIYLRVWSCGWISNSLKTVRSFQQGSPTWSWIYAERYRTTWIFWFYIERIFLETVIRSRTCFSSCNLSKFHHK